MAESNEFLDDDQIPAPGETEGSKLRKWGESQAKRAKELEKELSELKALVTKQSVDGLLAKYEVPEKVRKFYQGEATEDSVKAWVDEHAEVFGISRTENDEQTPEQQQKFADLESITQAALVGVDRPSALSRDSMAQLGKDLLSNKNTPLEEILTQMRVPNLPLQGPMM